MKKEVLVCGIHAVESVLERHPQNIKGLYIQKERASKERLQRLLQKAEAKQIDIYFVDSAELEKLAGELRHQGVLAELKNAAPKENRDLKQQIEEAETPPLFLILEGITDPHNFGAALRTADAAGVTAVIVPKDRSVGLTPVVRKVASGAAETVPIHFVTNLARTLEQMQELGVWIIGTALVPESQPIYTLDLSRPIAWVFGAEGSGLRQRTQSLCDEMAMIPMQGTVQSLNVSVAVGACLFETQRQRKFGNC